MIRYAILLLSLGTCGVPSTVQVGNSPQEAISMHPPTMVGEIPLPEGYQRIYYAPKSRATFLRTLALSDDPVVYLYNGNKKANQTAQYAVLQLDIGDRDLQQCADAAIRLHAEYYFQRKQHDKITYHFTNGFRCDFSRYAAGNRLRFEGNRCSWIRSTASDYSYAAFRKYLDLVYTYAGTQSLQASLSAQPRSEMMPGSLYLQSRQPYGHAVTVMDMAYHPQTGDTLFLLAQSYMPAQSIHILKNSLDPELSPWYSTRFGTTLVTPEWTFSADDLKAFE